MSTVGYLSSIIFHFDFHFVFHLHFWKLLPQFHNSSTRSWVYVALFPAFCRICIYFPFRRFQKCSRVQHTLLSNSVVCTCISKSLQFSDKKIRFLWEHLKVRAIIYWFGEITTLVYRSLVSFCRVCYIRFNLVWEREKSQKEKDITRKMSIRVLSIV